MLAYILLKFCHSFLFDYVIAQCCELLYNLKRKNYKTSFLIGVINFYNLEWSFFLVLSNPFQLVLNTFLSRVPFKYQINISKFQNIFNNINQTLFKAS